MSRPSSGAPDADAAAALALLQADSSSAASTSRRRLKVASTAPGLLAEVFYNFSGLSLPAEAVPNLRTTVPSLNYTKVHNLPGGIMAVANRTTYFAMRITGQTLSQTLPI
jgi:hypothetical protein